MEYDDIIAQIGGFGKYQKRQLVIAFFPVLITAFGSPMSIFLAGEQNYRCSSPFQTNYSLMEKNDFNDRKSYNLTGQEEIIHNQCYIRVNGSQLKCQQWEYDKTVFENTVISQFDLVCQNKLANSHATAAYFAGSAIAGVVMTGLADIFGRRIIACVSFTMWFITNISMPFSVSIHMFAVTRFFDGFCVAAVYLSIFVIGIELLDASTRMVAGTLISIVYCAGEFILTFLAYFIRDWRWLQLSTAIPLILPLTYWWSKLLPESVRWLISKGRTQEAIEVLRRAAKVNGTSLPVDLQFEKKEKISTIHVMKELVSSRKLLIFWGVTLSNWFVISFIYYGIKMNIGKFGGNIYLSFTLLVVAETSGFSLLFFMDRIGHKRLHMMAMGSACVMCIGSVFSIVFAGPSMQWLTIVFAMAGKLFVSTAFGMIYVYTGEIFPTVTRTFAIGSGNFIAKIGSLCSPYLYELAEGKMNKVLPLILYGVVITLVTLLTLVVLPETSKRRLPDNISDVDKGIGDLSHFEAVPTSEKEDVTHHIVKDEA